jgi:hypothetical protein
MSIRGSKMKNTDRNERLKGKKEEDELYTLHTIHLQYLSWRQ